ncbi:hypothetical protein [Streptomyces sp. NPDC056188]|uniref:hypothetical protein n=1 Tax=Streptomyces sp. NPDC056188 TaxID=3345740 RepID=UPI0035DF342F
MRQFVSRSATFAVNTETKKKEAKAGDAYVSAYHNNRLNQRLDVYVNSRRGTWADIVRSKPGWC